MAVSQNSHVFNIEGLELQDACSMWLAVVCSVVRAKFAAGNIIEYASAREQYL